MKSSCLSFNFYFTSNYSQTNNFYYLPSVSIIISRKWKNTILFKSLIIKTVKIIILTFFYYFNILVVSLILNCTFSLNEVDIEMILMIFENFGFY